jgi:hypothetical protein
MTERLKWALCRKYSDQTPYITRFESLDGDVGKKFFEEWARETGGQLINGEPGIGVLRSLDELACHDFAPAKVNPIVRAVYEQTSVMDLRIDSVDWGGWIARLFHFAYNRLFARGMMQLNAPVDHDTLPTLVSTNIGRLIANEGKEREFRAWTRTYTRTNQIFYTAAVFTFGADGPRGQQRYLCCILPLVHVNLAVVFHPENRDDGGLKLSTHKQGSYLAGVYAVFPGSERFTLIPAPMNEQIELSPKVAHSGPYLQGTHQTWAFGARSYTLHYQVRGPNRQS